MEKCFLILLLLTSFIFDIKSQKQVITECYSVENGLAHNSITDIIKDNDGFIWLSTKDGLSRFDGYNFKNFKAN